jgi:hypothetical protein
MFGCRLRRPLEMTSYQVAIPGELHFSEILSEIVCCLSSYLNVLGNVILNRRESRGWTTARESGALRRENPHNFSAINYPLSARGYTPKITEVCSCMSTFLRINFTTKISTRNYSPGQFNKETSSAQTVEDFLYADSMIDRFKDAVHLLQNNAALTRWRNMYLME